MGICRDQLTTYLQRFGYNVVRHPREGIAPLDVLGHQRGVMNYLGCVDKLMKNPGTLPTTKLDQTASNLNGQKSANLNVGVGLSLLKSVISGLGGDVGVTAKYGAASSVRFEFKNVLTDIAAPLDIAKFLNERVVDSDPLLEQYVGGDGTLYVITETVKSRELTVVAEKKGGGSLELDAPVIEAAIGGNIEVKADAASSGTVTYVGSKFLVFGFKCFEIGVENGNFQLFSSKPGGATAMSAEATTANAPPVLLAPDHLLTFSA